MFDMRINNKLKEKLYLQDRKAISATVIEWF